jgi:hypothetical protein
MRSLTAILLAATMGAAFQNPAAMLFEDVTSESGIRFTHTFGTPEKEFITDVNGSGAAFVDYDRDGLVDIYLINGSTREDLDSPDDGNRPRNALYRNNGDGTFTDVTEDAGVGDPGWGIGVATADYDNDGWVDIYITNYGRNVLYRNIGDGTFSDVTRDAGVGDAGYGTGATFGDYDRDGWVDLYVANYLEFDPARTSEDDETCGYKGIPVFCGPAGIPGARNVLYRNNKDGTFTNVTVETGMEDAEVLYTFTAVFEDFNDDGWPDLFLANDSAPNNLFENLGDGRFRDVGLEAGVAYSEDGRSQAGMGVAVADYDNDGRSDLFVTHFSDDYNTVYRNDGNLLFSDQSSRVRLAQPSIAMLGWGVLAEDFDNDGWRDVLVANGHIYPQVDDHPVGTAYRQPLQLFRNIENRFVDTERSAFPELAPLSGRAIVAGDIDNDGDLDVLVNQIDGPAILLLNRSEPAGNWIMLELEGRASNRSGIGARVKVVTETGTFWNRVRSGGAYVSQSDLRLHFGLGDGQRIEEVVVRWPSGRVSRLVDVEINGILKVREPSD